jgi:hypothetical protein
MVLGLFKHEHRFIGDEPGAQLVTLLQSINSKLDKIMDAEQEILAEVEALKAKEATLQTTLDSVQQTLTDTMAAKDVTIATAQAANETLKATILDLQGQLASGISPAGVQTLRESLGVVSQGLDTITTDVASTVSAPTPAPVVDPTPVVTDPTPPTV